ncbi:MAG TPA: DUF4397 domain-containing protein [Candidatus Polarisedimenticolaceae bacterium]|nr:DUF4397 domain-containing protein [Candidatus Polarisedimenticolaceae bacterium]
MKKLSLLTAGLLLLATAPALAGGSGSDARVRVVHASPDAPAVDVLVDGQRALTDISFRDVTSYARLRAGQYGVEVVPAGLDAPVVIDLTGQNAPNLFYNRDYTVVAVGRLHDLEPLLLVDDNRPLPPTKARVRFVHASPDAPAVDIAVRNGPVLFANVSFKGVGDFVEVPADTYDLEVRPAGSLNAVLTVPAVVLMSGTTYTIYATGLLGDGTLAPVVSVDSISPASRRMGAGR